MLAALAVGAGALWWLRQRTSGALPNLLQGLIPTARRMKLVESLRVSPRTSLLLVEVDGRTILLGEHAAGLVLLSPPVEPKHDE